MAVASALVPHARPDQRTSLALTSPGEKEQKKWENQGGAGEDGENKKVGK